MESFFEKNAAEPCEMDEKTRMHLEQAKAFEDYVGRIAAERVSQALGVVVGKIREFQPLIPDEALDAHVVLLNGLDEIIDALTQGK
jgi:hypothetical protein